MTLTATQCTCGREPALLLGHKDERSVGVCPVCGMIRTLQRADNYETLYASDAYHKAEIAARSGQPSYYARAEHDYAVGVERLARFHRRRSWLDVGCANGGFLRAATAAGYNAVGLEPNPEMAAFAADYSGCVVCTDRAEVATWQFDVISYHDVFEHVVDPHAELRWIRRHLKPEGQLVLDVPDAADPRFTTLGMEWHHMKPQEHLWFFSARTLTAVLQAHDFRIDAFDTPIPGKLVVYATGPETPSGTAWTSGQGWDR